MPSVITLDNWIDADRRLYRTKRHSTSAGMVGIKDALEKGVTGIIKEVSDENKEAIFYMLCFCISVPQSKAVKVDEAVQLLKVHKFYENPLTIQQIIEILRTRARFQNRKAAYLAKAREIFLGTGKYTLFWETLKVDFKEWPHKSFAEKKSVRAFIEQKFDGMGMKESSHFLRNIGMPGLAILDVHIFNGLKDRGLIAENLVLTKAIYPDIEDIMLDYAAKVGISLEELDLLLWSERTGYVYK